MLLQQIVTALLLAIAPAVGIALAVMTAMVGVVGLFLGWDNIRKAVDLEYAHWREGARAQRAKDQARFEAEHPGFAGLLYGVADRVYGPREDRAAGDKYTLGNVDRDFDDDERDEDE